MHDFNLVDIPLTACAYTWTKRKGSPNKILEKLDRAMTTSTWLDNFPNCCLKNLICCRSNHSPILLKLSRHTRTRKTKRFHFENSLLEEGRKCLQSLDGDVQRERERWPSLNCTLFRVGKPPNFTTWSWRAVLETKGQSILVTWWWFQTLATSKRQRTWGKRGIWWRNFLTRTLLDHNTGDPLTLLKRYAMLLVVIPPLNHIRMREIQKLCKYETMI